MTPRPRLYDHMLEAHLAQHRQMAFVSGPRQVGILKIGRVVFNIKANDYRLIALVQYKNGVVMIRFFGSHGGCRKST